MRKITQVFSAPTLSEGAGFKVKRPIGSTIKYEETDPFLLLDELGPITYSPGEFKGAPWHPHRGFDTVMYIKEGYSYHQDSLGNKGELRSGDCQWMTTGSGIVHDECGDGQHPGGKLHGFQLWVNLPNSLKFTPPKYIDVRNDSFLVENGTKYITDSNSKNSAIQPLTPIDYLDIEVHSGQVKKIDFIKLPRTMLYIYNTKGVYVNDIHVTSPGTLIIFDEDMSIGTDIILDRSESQTNCLLLAGIPIREEIYWKGPFVLGSRKDLETAFSEYYSGVDRFIKHSATYSVK